jgi:hypothetical protein
MSKSNQLPDRTLLAGTREGQALAQAEQDQVSLSTLVFFQSPILVLFLCAVYTFLNRVFFFKFCLRVRWDVIFKHI